MFAERFRQEPAKVASIVIIGNLVALLSISAALALRLAGRAPQATPRDIERRGKLPWRLSPVPSGTRRIIRSPAII